MILVLAFLILFAMILIINERKQKTEEELIHVIKKLNRVEKKWARQVGKEEASKQFAKERFYKNYKRFLKAKKEIVEKGDKKREDYLYLAIIMQILDKYDEVIKNDESYQEKEEEVLKQITKIMRTHYYSNWVDELD